MIGDVDRVLLIGTGPKIEDVAITVRKRNDIQAKDVVGIDERLLVKRLKSADVVDIVVNGTNFENTLTIGVQTTKCGGHGALKMSLVKHPIRARDSCFADSSVGCQFFRCVTTSPNRFRNAVMEDENENWDTEQDSNANSNTHCLVIHRNRSQCLSVQ